MSSDNKSDGSGYKLGYSKAATSSHASRTIYTDAAFAIPHIKPHHRVLDVGSGPGTITIGFATLVDGTKGGSVVGIDTGEEVVTSASQLANEHSLGKDVIRFTQGDILEGLPFDDESFDVVFTSQTMTHLAPAPDMPVKALKEMRRVLKKDGFLAARDAASLTFSPFREDLQRKLTDRMYAVVGTNEPCGLHMQEYLRAAGWDLDSGIASDKVIIGGGSTIVTGKDKVKWWKDVIGGRLEQGEPFRESWLKHGFTGDECDETKALIERWAQSEDAWYGALQTEVLAWK
ncbi:hypothetical protein Daus18300_008540 [Diaporthe australafricana]|uniref:Methyltransferase domain-containing protein n=1 Tax=Diaporthe australafricana TaxID=127596 RepID=A0ABR3WIA9_9PEZI